ncbi:uncharacterized protein DFL_007283 [Arthrobotrys flagrans]|uniref:Uncharacterized protein n=1 Tax=Arthrobotrys flagrans TaxID=97331 RepID=A0A436ZVK6_ARTFL|nr:hypothetical protein DFL_007283 [Arthrobotrys flagrans]
MESESFSGSWTDEQTAEASEKVLRRAKVSRMARQLQSRLALASYKTQRGWENLDLDTIEPRVDQDLMRKRMQSIRESSPPLHRHLANGNNHYDDNLAGLGINNMNSSNNIRRRPGSGSSSSNTASPAHRKKRARTAAPFGDHTRGLYIQNSMEDRDVDVDMVYEPSARHSFRNHNKNRLAWKESHRLPQSSPGYHHHSHHHHNSSFDMGSQPQFSFTNSPTRNGSPTFEISHHSRHYSHHYHHQDYEPQPVFHSSPPRTPPHRTMPARPVFTTAGEKLEERSNRGNNNNSNSHNGNNGGKADGEGADLLLYLATSPSPNTMTKTNVSVAPSTPPSKGSAAALPSSMMNTPGGGGGGGGGGSGSFNFHDFVHITPSPAQVMWGNGGSGRTPMTMQARRRLNFDGLVPPSPMNGSQGSQGKVTGLGMELGGELVSPTSGL